MKRFFKPLASTILASTLLLSLTGCSGDKGNAADNNSQVSEKTEDITDTNSGEGSTQTTTEEIVRHGEGVGYVIDVPEEFKFNKETGGYGYNMYYEPYIWTADMTFYETEEDFKNGMENFTTDYSDAKTLDGFTVKEKTGDDFYGNLTQYFIKLEDGTNYGCRVLVSHSEALDKTQSENIINVLKSIRKK